MPDVTSVRHSIYNNKGDVKTVTIKYLSRLSVWPLFLQLFARQQGAAEKECKVGSCESSRECCHPVSRFLPSSPATPAPSLGHAGNEPRGLLEAQNGHCGWHCQADGGTKTKRALIITIIFSRNILQTQNPGFNAKAQAVLKRQHNCWASPQICLPVPKEHSPLLVSEHEALGKVFRIKANFCLAPILPQTGRHPHVLRWKPRESKTQRERERDFNWPSVSVWPSQLIELLSLAARLWWLP